MEEVGAELEWIDTVKNFLRERNIRFEAEESVRIHLNDVLIEISRLDEDKYIMLINIEIPKTLSIDEIDRYSSMYRDFLRIISRASAEPMYELDTSTGYVFLRASLEIHGLNNLINSLEKILS